MSFEFTPKQEAAIDVLSSTAKHCMLFGGSRSGKTFLILYVIAFRAIAADNSRHAVLRFRFNHVKASVTHDTWPKMMNLCFPEVKYHMDKTDWFCQFPNGSQIWFGGLDDKERTEKILGQEYVSIYFNESSQIPYNSRNLAMTRLAQAVTHKIDGTEKPVRGKAYYDCNPPSQAHWSYKLFVQKRDPDTGKAIADPEQYAPMQINPQDNVANLPADYLQTLDAMPARMRLRFLEGVFADITANSLFSLENIEKWRTIDNLPDMQRIVVSVDPSGSGDQDNADNDAIGIVVAGLGVDGNGYLLEDLTVKAGPKTWGNVAATAFDRHAADLVVGETNYGGEMVKFVIQTARPNTPFRKLTATRGKVVRAEPISALVESGKVRMAGRFLDLEDELCAFTTSGYLGDKSPNRADAFIWAMSALFPGIIKEPTLTKERTPRRNLGGDQAWMS